MKEVAGPAIIYSYYVERFLELKQNEELGKLLLELNSKVRDSGAKIVYSLYDKAHDALLKKYKNKEIDWLTLSELNRTSEKRSIDERKKFYVFLGAAKSSMIYTGEKAKKFLTKEKFTEIKNLFSKTEVTGLPAGGGIVGGIVKVVRGMKDMENCAGKIVVSRDTIIEYTPMLKKNLAIVTDLGGISCHAVVTAREFKIPCVVGTKYATEVFKDGDLVEVDANKGIVKILGSSNRNSNTNINRIH
jgi:phosphoenolpyruvate synthase/pyruvate phosphate dikinase